MWASKEIERLLFKFDKERQDLSKAERIRLYWRERGRETEKEMVVENEEENGNQWQPHKISSLKIADNQFTCGPGQYCQDKSRAGPSRLELIVIATITLMIVRAMKVCTITGRARVIRLRP